MSPGPGQCPPAQLLPRGHTSCAAAAAVLLPPTQSQLAASILHRFGWTLAGCHSASSADHCPTLLRPALTLACRTWGGSDGEPRQLVSGPMFAEDYVSAVDHLVGSGGLGGLVDPGRLVLWGTSYSGGHCVVAAAARPEQVAAVVAMVRVVGRWLTGLIPVL